MDTNKTRAPRSIGQIILAGIFALLSAGFAFRFIQFLYKWISGAKEGDQNFKALTVWALIYLVVCGGIAALAWWFPADEPEPEPEQKQS